MKINYSNRLETFFSKYITEYKYHNSDCLNRFYSKKCLKPPFYVLTEKLTVKNGYKKT